MTKFIPTAHFICGNAAKIKVELLTGSVSSKEKREIKSRLIDGEIDLLIGTHAIIQNDVEYIRVHNVELSIQALRFNERLMFS